MQIKFLSRNKIKFIVYCVSVIHFQVLYQKCNMASYFAHYVLIKDFKFKHYDLL